MPLLWFMRDELHLPEREYGCGSLESYVATITSPLLRAGTGILKPKLADGSHDPLVAIYRRRRENVSTKLTPVDY